MIKRNWKILFVTLSQILDIITIFIAALFCVVIRSYEPHFNSPPEQLIFGLGIFIVISMTVSSLTGLYRGSLHLSFRLQNFIMIKSFVISIMITLSIIPLFKINYIDRQTIIVFSCSLPIFLFFGRYLLYSINLFAQSKGYGIHNSLIVGYDIEGINIADRFNALPELGYKINGFVVKEDHLVLPQGIKSYKINELEEVILDNKIDRIFIPSTDLIVNGYSSVKNLSVKHNIKLKILSPASEELLKISRIYDIAGITITSPPRYNVNKVKYILKRMFDLIAGSIITLILSPIFLITIVAIFIESGRPIFFMQRRSSIKNGKEFFFIKFRSMVTNAEEMKSELWKNNESDGALFKLKDDPRTTKVGKFIRKYSIDELPQLFNVLLGDMSLVGPRPLPISDLEHVDESDEFWDAIKDRASVKPGMTGLWQVSGRSRIKFREMILLDLYYVENQSLLFDVEILFETIPTVLFGKGAY